MHLFYTPDISNGTYTLTEQESKHSIKVLRLKSGDTIHLTDGKGSLYECEIINDKAKECIVSIKDIVKEHGKRNFYLHIAVAPTKTSVG